MRLHRGIASCALLAAGLIGLSASDSAGESKSAGGGARIPWASDYEAALEEAEVEGKLVMVDFFTDWCGWCRRLDADTYQNPEVVTRARRLVCVRVNAERRVDLARRYKVRAYPSIAFVHPDGSLMEMIRGYQPPGLFASALDRATDTRGERFILTQRLRDHPDLSEVRYDLALLLLRNGEDSLALNQVDTLLTGGSDLLEDAIRGLRLARGRLLLSLGRPHDAREDLSIAVDKCKGSTRYGEALYYLAEAALADGDVNEARKLYKKLLQERPQGWLAERSRSRLSDLG